MIGRKKLNYMTCLKRQHVFKSLISKFDPLLYKDCAVKSFANKSYVKLEINFTDPAKFMHI